MVNNDFTITYTPNAGICGPDDGRDEVGKALADTGAGFKEKGNVLILGPLNRERHRFLLGPVFEREAVDQPAGIREDRGDQSADVGGHPPAGLFTEADHLFLNAGAMWIIAKENGVVRGERPDSLRENSFASRRRVFGV